MITAPPPANPYLIPKNEETIKAMFKTELPKIYLTFDLLIMIGCLKKKSIGKKARLIIKNRQNTMISIEREGVSTLSALQPPAQKIILRMSRYLYVESCIVRVYSVRVVMSIPFSFRRFPNSTTLFFHFSDSMKPA